MDNTPKKSETSEKVYYKNLEEFTEALNQELRKRGLTETTIRQPKPATSKPKTYHVRIIR